MNLQPVYPKDDPEYRKRIMEAFYKTVRDTNWGASDESEYQGRPRGRKAKVIERVESKPRTVHEMNAYKNKFFNYNK